MNITTKIRGSKVLYDWDENYDYLRGRRLWIDYGEQITAPTHILNFTAALVMLGPASLNTTPFNLSELTQPELDTLNQLVKMLIISKGCGGYVNIRRGHRTPYKKDDSGGFTATHIISDTPIRGDGPMLVAQGLGKDGLNIALMTKTLGFNAESFIVKNELTQKLWTERMSVAYKFHTEINMRCHIIDTNWYKDVRAYINPADAFVPEYMILPLAWKHNVEAIYRGTHIHFNNFREKDLALHCPQSSVFGGAMIGKVTGIPTSSPHIGLTNYGAQKLLGDNHPEMLHYQRSCMHGMRWCNNCGKCNNHYVVYKLHGYDTDKVGLNPQTDYGRSIRDNVYKDACGLSGVMNLQLYNKLTENIEPDEWVTGVNKIAYNNCYRGKEYLDYIAEILEVYSHDPGGDGFGWTSKPSIWSKVIERGYLEEYYDYNSSGNKTTDN